MDLKSLPSTISKFKAQEESERLDFAEVGCMPQTQCSKIYLVSYQLMCTMDQTNTSSHTEKLMYSSHSLLFYKVKQYFVYTYESTYRESIGPQRRVSSKYEIAVTITVDNALVGKVGRLIYLR